MDTLKDLLKREIASYAKKGINGYTSLAINNDETEFVVTGVGYIRGERIVNIALLVHLQNDLVIIDRDSTNKPLLHSLLDAGIPRSQIILAYNGEPVPQGG